MNLKIFEKNLRIIQKQRNMLLLFVILSLAANLFLAAKNFLSDKRIILVPGLNQPVWLEEKSVSSSYIEEITILMLNHLLDLSHKNIQYKKSLILNHISTSNKVPSELIGKYFEDIEEKYKKFDLITHFTIKDIIIDIDNLSAKAKGLLTSNYGKRGLTTSEEEYYLKFELIRGFLKLKSFENIAHEEN